MAMPLTPTAAGELPAAAPEVCRLTTAMAAGNEEAYRQFDGQNAGKGVFLFDESDQP